MQHSPLSGDHSEARHRGGGCIPRQGSHLLLLCWGGEVGIEETREGGRERWDVMRVGMKRRYSYRDTGVMDVIDAHTQTHIRHLPSPHHQRLKRGTRSVPPVSAASQKPEHHQQRRCRGRRDMRLMAVTAFESSSEYMLSMYTRVSIPRQHPMSSAFAPHTHFVPVVKLQVPFRRRWRRPCPSPSPSPHHSRPSRPATGPPPSCCC